MQFSEHLLQSPMTLNRVQRKVVGHLSSLSSRQFQGRCPYDRAKNNIMCLQKARTDFEIKTRPESRKLRSPLSADAQRPADFERSPPSVETMARLLNCCPASIRPPFPS